MECMRQESSRALVGEKDETMRFTVRHVGRVRVNILQLQQGSLWAFLT